MEGAGGEPAQRGYLRASLLLRQGWGEKKKGSDSQLYADG